MRTEALQAEDLARVLFVLSFRSEDVGSVPFLAELLARARMDTRLACELGPLATAEAKGGDGC